MHPMLLITRADAESTRLISSTVGTRDHPSILGVTSRDKALVEAVEDAEARDDGAAEVCRIEAEWLACNKLVTFDETVERDIHRSAIKDDEAVKSYLATAEGKSNADVRDIAKDILGEPVFWDWDRAYPLRSQPARACSMRPAEGETPSSCAARDTGLRMPNCVWLNCRGAPFLHAGWVAALDYDACKDVLSDSCIPSRRPLKSLSSIRSRGPWPRAQSRYAAAGSRNDRTR
ncbi:ICL-domain-containing protein [Laetiporus sulphureus 93-53]|uniref:methylisocitrate lyase n=1 Tax=Laetiporus sulphureus 93-53 TaxID=1314785 RepID=A0A165AUV0_9APHY|nr:ICL-domain-containing protein [Laetiporus sulphureus 93-53]KZS99706.1 ICL-domain-containing protein [Laetiporus sulphureus 93-53]